MSTGVLVGPDGGQEVVLAHRARTRVGRLCSGYADHALLVTDSGLNSATPHVQETVDRMTASGVHTDVLSLPSDQTGTVGSARLVRDRMRMTGSRLCVALGGGSAIDAAKLARAAHHRPWLLDRAIWRRPTGCSPSPTRGALIPHPTS